MNTQKRRRLIYNDVIASKKLGILGVDNHHHMC